MFLPPLERTCENAPRFAVWALRKLNALTHKGYEGEWPSTLLAFMFMLKRSLPYRHTSWTSALRRRVFCVSSVRPPPYEPPRPAPSAAPPASETRPTPSRHAAAPPLRGGVREPALCACRTRRRVLSRVFRGIIELNDVARLNSSRSLKSGYDNCVQVQIQSLLTPP